MLQTATQNGTAKKLRSLPFPIAAKTGTSEKKDKYDASGNTSYRVSSCIAYAPSEYAQVAVIILVDEPTVGSAYGSVVAAPYVSKLMEQVLPYMGIDPSYSETDEEHKQIIVKDYVGYSIIDIEKELKKEGIVYELIGDGETVISQMPIANSLIYAKTGKILLYTTNNEEDVLVATVPDLVGRTPMEANIIISNSGLNVKISGSKNFANGSDVKVISQYPSAGEKIKVGEVVTITLLHTDEKE
jgi:stage V sporulation protein D (sporulation-specific penicillin-binding protein)